MIRNVKKSQTFLTASLDISGVLPETPDTEFEEVLLFNQENSLEYRKYADPRDYPGSFHQISTTALTTSVYSNPTINHLNPSTNVALEDVQVFLTSTLDCTCATYVPDVLSTNTYGNFITCGVTVPNTREAYFGTGVNLGCIIKINTETLQVLDVISIDPNGTRYGDLTCAVIDPLDQFAYFGSQEGYIIKVDLGAFIQVGELKLSLNRKDITTAVISPTGNFAYFSSNLGPDGNRVNKIDLVLFLEVGSIQVSSGGEDISCSVILPSGQFAFFGSTINNFVYKVQLSPSFVVIGSSAADPGRSLTCAAIDATGTFAYFGSQAQPSVKVREYNLAGALPVLASSLIISSVTDFQVAVLDPNGAYVYFGEINGPIWRLNLSTFTMSGTLTLVGVPLPTSLRAAVTYANGGTRRAFFGLYTNPGEIAAVDLESFTQLPLILRGGNGEVNEDIIRSSVVDPQGNFAYFGMFSGVPGVIAKINLNTFSSAGQLVFADPLHSDFQTAVIDPSGNYAYFGTSSGFAIVVKIELSTFTFSAALTLEANKTLRASVVDPNGNYAYFAAEGSPGKLYKVDLNTFSLTGSLTLGVGQNDPLCAVIDKNGQYAYFGLETTPAQIIKLDLSSFTVASVLTLNLGDNNIRSAAIDPDGRYAYFGTSGPAKVFKIDLVQFSKVNTLVHPTATDLFSAAMEIDGEHVYFATANEVGKIIKINLLNFTYETKGVGVGVGSMYTGVTNPRGNFVYFGTSTSPGKIVAVATEDSYLISGLSGNVPGNLVNTTTTVEIDNESQILRLPDNNYVKKIFYLALYVKGRTGLQPDKDPCIIRTQVKSYNRT